MDCGVWVVVSSHTRKGSKNGDCGWSRNSFISSFCQDPVYNKKSLFSSLPEPFRFCLSHCISVWMFTPLQENPPSRSEGTKIEYDDRGQLGKQKGYMPSRTSLALHLKQERSDVHLVGSVGKRFYWKCQWFWEMSASPLAHFLVHQTKSFDSISWFPAKT